MDLAAQLTDARYGALAVVDRDGTITDFLTTGLSRKERRAIGPLPSGRGLLGALLEGSHPIRVSHIAGDPRSAGFPPNHPPMTTFLGAPVRARGQLYGNIYLTEKRGGVEFTQQDEDDLVVLAAQAGVAVANATLYEEVRRRERWLDALRQTTGAILGNAPLESVLQLICKLARELAAASLATVVTVTEHPGSLVVAAADGAYSARLLGRGIPMTGSVSGEVIRGGAPLVLDDVRRDSRTYEPIVRQGRVGPCIFAPLTARGRVFGTLAVSGRAGAQPFPPAAVHLVETFAGQASVALDSYLARQQAERLAILEERERIAQELHDDVVQALFGVGMSLQATAALVSGTKAEQRLEEASGQIDRAIVALRNHVFGLRPDRVADRQLDEGLRTLAADMRERSGVATEVDVDPDVASGLASAAGDILAIAREALANVDHHAAASRCAISLRRGAEGAAVLTIEDDGDGFDTVAAGPGRGLASIRDRVARLGGTTELDAQPGSGTRLRLLIPTLSGV